MLSPPVLAPVVVRPKHCSPVKETVIELPKREKWFYGEDFPGKQVCFTDTAVKCGPITIPYNEVTGVLYTATKETINWVLPGRECSGWTITSTRSELSLHFHSEGIEVSGRRERREVYHSLVTATEKHISSQLATRFWHDIVNDTAPVNIAGITLARQGIHYPRRRYFGRDQSSFMPWSALEWFLIDGTTYSIAGNSVDVGKTAAKWGCGFPHRGDTNSVLLPRLIFACSETFGTQARLRFFDRLLQRQPDGSFSDVKKA